MTVHLSVEEALEYQRFESELSGFQAGVAAALDFTRKKKIEGILRARQTAESANIGETK